MKAPQYEVAESTHHRYECRETFCFKTNQSTNYFLYRCLFFFKFSCLLAYFQSIKMWYHIFFCKNTFHFGNCANNNWCTCPCSAHLLGLKAPSPLRPIISLKTCFVSNIVMLWRLNGNKGCNLSGENNSLGLSYESFTHCWSTKIFWYSLQMGILETNIGMILQNYPRYSFKGVVTLRWSFSSYTKLCGWDILLLVVVYCMTQRPWSFLC